MVHCLLHQEHLFEVVELPYFLLMDCWLVADKDGQVMVITPSSSSYIPLNIHVYCIELKNIKLYVKGLILLHEEKVPMLV